MYASFYGIHHHTTYTAFFKPTGSDILPQYRGMPGPGSRNGWVGEQGEGRTGRGRGFLEGKPGKGIIFEL